MPISEPSNIPADTTPTPRDLDTPAAALADDRLNDAPGGGGLMGAGDPEPLAGTAAGQTGAATPNSPIDAHLPHDAADRDADREAQALSTGDDTATERGAA